MKYKLTEVGVVTNEEDKILFVFRCHSEFWSQVLSVLNEEHVFSNSELKFFIEENYICFYILPENIRVDVLKFFTPDEEIRQEILTILNKRNETEGTEETVEPVSREQS